MLYFVLKVTYTLDFNYLFSFLFVHVENCYNLIGFSPFIQVLQVYVAVNSSSLFFSQPPLPSSRPPVTGYKISNNITGTVLVNQTHDTTFVAEGVPGTYLLTVLAVNLLGDGEKESTFIILSGCKYLLNKVDWMLRLININAIIHIPEEK